MRLLSVRVCYHCNMDLKILNSPLHFIYLFVGFSSSYGFHKQKNDYNVRRDTTIFIRTHSRTGQSTANNYWLWESDDQRSEASTPTYTCIRLLLPLCTCMGIFLFFLNSYLVTKIQIFLKAVIKYWIRHLRMPDTEEYQNYLEHALALAYLPAHEIANAARTLFQTMVDNNAANALEFYNYYRRTWVPLAELISVFGQRVKTNNLCENFHSVAINIIGESQGIWFMLRKQSYWYS